MKSPVKSPEPTPYDWASLVSNQDSDVALGAILQWLRTNSMEYKKENVGKLLETVSDRNRQAAFFLTSHLIDYTDDVEWKDIVTANRIFKKVEPVWIAFLRSRDTEAAVYLLSGANSHLRRLLRGSLLREFHINNSVAVVVEEIAKTRPDLKEWCEGALLYKPLSDAVDMGQ